MFCIIQSFCVWHHFLILFMVCLETNLYTNCLHFQYIFHPQVLCCYGKHLCTIPRDAAYWTYQNRYVVPSDSRHFVLNYVSKTSVFTWFLTSQLRTLYWSRLLLHLLKNIVPIINLVFISFDLIYKNIQVHNPHKLL